jgi:arylsulfatase A-like enzyme
MSGQYGPRTGVYTVGPTTRFNTSKRPLVPVENVLKLPLDKITLGDTIKRAGYATGYFGKWHLGEDAQHHPRARGFDEAVVSMGKHFKFRTNPPVDVLPDVYLADFLTDKGLDFIDRHKDGPFFLFLAHFAVHVPHDAKADLIEHFKGKPPGAGHRDPVYAAMIASVDASVGRVLAKLDELHLADDTLVVFSSDNGGVGGYEAAGIRNAKGITDNAPLRGGKGMLYEGGVRVPFIARWPGRIKPGSVSEEPIISVDLLPTFTDVAAAEPSHLQPVDGRSIVPVLTGRQATLSRDALYWHFPGYLGAGRDNWRTTPAGAIRVGDYKLLEFFEDNRLELYNVRDDVGQKHDLAADKPDLVRNLHARLKEWRTSVKAPMPTRRAAVDAVLKSSRISTP